MFWLAIQIEDILYSVLKKHVYDKNITTGIFRLHDSIWVNKNMIDSIKIPEKIKVNNWYEFKIKNGFPGNIIETVINDLRKGTADIWNELQGKTPKFDFIQYNEKKIYRKHNWYTGTGITKKIGKYTDVNTKSDKLLNSSSLKKRSIASQLERLNKHFNKYKIYMTADRVEKFNKRISELENKYIQKNKLPINGTDIFSIE